MQNVVKAALLALVVMISAPLEYAQAHMWVPHDRHSESKIIARGWTLGNQSDELEWAGAQSARTEFSVVVVCSKLTWSRLWAELSQSPPVAIDIDN